MRPIYICTEDLSRTIRKGDLFEYRTYIENDTRGHIVLDGIGQNNSVKWVTATIRDEIFKKHFRKFA